MAKAKKKTSKRQRERYPNLKKEYALRSRQELVDFDYLHKLNDSELSFLNRFMGETVHNIIDRKNLNNNTSNTLEYKQECDRLHNRRRKDLYTRVQAYGKLDSWEDSEWKSLSEKLDDLDDTNDECEKTENSTEDDT